MWKSRAEEYKSDLEEYQQQSLEYENEMEQEINDLKQRNNDYADELSELKVILFNNMYIYIFILKFLIYLIFYFYYFFLIRKNIVNFMFNQMNHAQTIKMSLTI